MLNIVNSEPYLISIVEIVTIQDNRHIKEK